MRTEIGVQSDLRKRKEEDERGRKRTREEERGRGRKRKEEGVRKMAVLSV